MVLSSELAKIVSCVNHTIDMTGATIAHRLELGLAIIKSSAEHLDRHEKAEVGALLHEHIHEIFGEPTPN